jgi:hypothetical protein
MIADQPEARIVAGKRAALNAFPDKAKLVEDLASNDDAFQDMCEELAECHAAMVRARAIASPMREERIKECLGWIERITSEMEAALLSKRTSGRVLPRLIELGRRWMQRT